MPLTQDAPLVLHHHPFTRAANVVGMLEETGVPYSLVYVDVPGGEHKRPSLVTKNKMGKLPTLVDDGMVVTESAAIGLYLADRYAPGRLAPTLDDPARGTYLRWSFFAPSVIEPAAYAQSAKWEYKPGSAGWGRYDDVLDAMSAAIQDVSGGPWLLGDRFTMADIIFGGTLRYMMMFKMIDPRDEYVAYTEALSQRPSMVRAKEINDAIVAERGLGG